MLLVLLVEVGGLGLAHPSAVAGLVVVAGPLVVGAVARGVAAGLRHPDTRRPTAWLLAAAAAVTVAVGVAASRVDLLASVMAYPWPDDVGLPEAVGEALLLAPARGRPAALLLAVLAVVGAVGCWRRRQHVWLAVAAVVAAGLFVVAETTPAHLLTGAWYNDSNRLAILLVVPAVVLAAVASAHLGTVLAARWPGGALGAVSAAVGAPVLVALAVALGPGNGMTAARGAVAAAFPAEPGPEQVISTDELALYRRLADEVPAGAVIANDPFQGTSVVLAMADRVPLFPHLAGRWDSDALLLGSSLDRVGTDPAVCAAARAKGVGYLLDTGFRSYPWLPAAPLFAGVVDASASDAFTLVDEVGTARLYRLTACAGA